MFVVKVQSFTLLFLHFSAKLRNKRNQSRYKSPVNLSSLVEQYGQWRRGTSLHKMSREEGVIRHACRSRWQLWKHEDKTLSREFSSPLSPLLVGSRGVDSVGLAWWNWFDKRGTTTPVNELSILNAHTGWHTVVFLNSQRCLLLFSPQSHTQGWNVGGSLTIRIASAAVLSCCAHIFSCCYRNSFLLFHCFGLVWAWRALYLESRGCSSLTLTI